MDPYGFRQRNYMAPPQYGTGTFGIQRPPTPFMGMEIQGPMGSEPMGGGDLNLNVNLPEPGTFEQSFPRSKPTTQLGSQDFASAPAEQKPFTGMEIQGPLSAGQAPNARPGDDFDIFEQMYNAPTPALEAYKRHIGSMPKQEQYQPNKFDRVAAALTGAAEGMNRGAGAGYQASRAMIERPYQLAVQSHQQAGQGLGQLAEIESADMKNKMGYAKTMMEAKREAMKTAADISRLDKQNQLTDVQMEEARVRMKTAGLDLERSPADGMLYVVDKAKGTRTPVGKFDQTPQEKADLEVNTYGRKAGTDFGYDKSMAGVNFGFDTQRKAIDQENRLGAFAFEEGTRSTNRVREHKQNRLVDAANPIPQSSYDSVAASQDSIARLSVMQQASLDRPEFLQFQVDSIGGRQRAAEDEPELYKEYQAAVSKNMEGIISRHMKRPIGGGAARPEVSLPSTAPITAPATPEVKVPTVSQSPLTAPSVSETPERAAAIKQLETDGQPTTPAMIEWMMKQLAR